MSALIRTVVLVIALAWTPRATAVDTCTLPNVGALVFGGYDAISGSAVDSTGSVTYHCTGTPETIEISLGPGGASSFAPRLLASGAHGLAYNLFLDGARTTIWGDGTGGTTTWQGTAVIGENTTLTIFGRILGGQNAHVGSYGDSIVVTITY